MQRFGLMKPVQSYYELTVQKFSPDGQPLIKPIITVNLSKATCLIELADVPGFTFTVGAGNKISFSIDLSSENFKQADVSFRWAVQKSQQALVLFTRDVVEIIKCYEKTLRELQMLEVDKSSCSHKDYVHLGNFRPDGNAF